MTPDEPGDADVTVRIVLNNDLKDRVAALCGALTARAAAGHPEPHWFEPKSGPSYNKVLLHSGPIGVPTREPATFCFVSREDAPFGWANFRAGDVLPPMTSRRPWKMDTGAVGNLFAPDGGISYWVLRYGADLGLW